MAVDAGFTLKELDQIIKDGALVGQRVRVAEDPRVLWLD